MRNGFTIDWILSSCQSGRTQRHDIHASANLVKPGAIAPKNFKVREAPMRKEHRLRALQMRVSGNDDFSIRVRQIEQRRLRFCERTDGAIDFLAQPQTQVRRDLVVSTSARVQLAPNVADHLDQSCYDERMHIFRSRVVKVRRIRLSLRENAAQR